MHFYKKNSYTNEDVLNVLYKNGETKDSHTPLTEIRHLFCHIVTRVSCLLYLLHLHPFFVQANNKWYGRQHKQKNFLRWFFGAFCVWSFSCFVSAPLGHTDDSVVIGKVTGGRAPTEFSLGCWSLQKLEGT